MHKAAAVRDFQGFGDFGGDVQGFGQRQRSGSKLLINRLAGDELHHQEQFTGLLADFVDFADERVIERGGGRSFAAKAFARGGVRRQVCWQQFDRDLAAELGVLGAVDFAHSTGADLGDDYVGAELVARGVWHRKDSAYFTNRVSPNSGARNGSEVQPQAELNITGHADGGRDSARVGIAD